MDLKGKQQGSSKGIQNIRGGEDSSGEKTRLWILTVSSLIVNVITTTMKRVYNSGLSLIKFQYSIFSQSKPKAIHTKSNSTGILERTLNCQKITKNLELVKNDDGTSSSSKDNNNATVLTSDSDAPLCILMGWMLAKRNHLMRYTNIYVDKGFDVLVTRFDMTQFMFPTSTNGAQNVARDLIKFLSENPQYERKMIVHGFSGAAYFWGEVLTLLNKEPKKYGKIIEGCTGQIWDSPAGFAQIAPSFGTAVFPKSYILQNMMRVYAELHMKFLYEQATKHYDAARHHYENTQMKCPALFFCSENDPISLYSYVQSVAKRWSDDGIDVRLRSWKESPHVSHMWSHPEDYREELNKFIDRIFPHENLSRLAAATTSKL